MRPLAAILPLAAASPTCRCIPSDSCWPSERQWSLFNETLGGGLIRTTPVPAPCYSGPHADEQACEEATRGFASAHFQAAQPLGYAYPLNSSCPLIPFDNATSTHCKGEVWPVYAVNVTQERDVVDSMRFAKENNFRVVVKSSGHDFLQRSSGQGSLSIWLHHYRQGFFFSPNNTVAEQCAASSWRGGTLRIVGSYAWSDLYPAARDEGVILVGGNNEGPSSTGGWVQGGGHSPVTRYYGLGADQVLSARVVLASGEVVTASPCENERLFYAIRGGGGGTYGVVTEMVVKTYPTQEVHVADLVIESEGEDGVPRFLDAVAAVYAAFPTLSEAEFAGYGSWVAHLPQGAGTVNTLEQSFTRLGGTANETRTLFKPFAAKLLALTGVRVSITYSSYADYGSYYAAKPGTDAKVGGVSALSSRLLSADGLCGNATNLRLLMDVFAGSQGKPVFHTIVHHGLAAADPSLATQSSAVQRGWYESVILDIFERGVRGFLVSENEEVFAHVREVIEPAYRALSPTTGTYMNEADWGEANWREDFYSDHWEELSRVKREYDPDGAFYCPTCVGSQEWALNDVGALCRKN